MPIMRKAITISAALTFLLLSSNALALVYKCVGSRGYITFTDKPCPTDSKSSVIRASTGQEVSKPQSNGTHDMDKNKSQGQPEEMNSVDANKSTAQSGEKYN